MEAITARQARRMVRERLGEVRQAELTPEVKAQIKLFEEELNRAIINKKVSFEIQFREELHKETIETITDRGFKIWKVYRSKDRSTYEISLDPIWKPKSNEDVCVSYKFYF